MGVEDKHLLFPMPLLKPQFDAIHTRRADPSRYLIIGFDTKYQRYADEDTRTKPGQRSCAVHRCSHRYIAE